jgi:hypothetical protein
MTTMNLQPMDERKPALTKAAARGDLETVKRIVEASAAISILEKNKTINYAPIWTELLEEERGNLIQQEWFDVTAITMAAIRGHHHILQYLLEEGADPTLRGCPKDAVRNDDFDPIAADQKDLHMNAFDTAKDLCKQIRCCRRSHDLLMICKPYWKRCNYSSSNASKCKRETFTNTPVCELSYLKEIIKRVPPISQYPLKCDYYDGSLIDDDVIMPIATSPVVGQKRLIDQQQQQQPVYSGGRLRRCFICNEAKNETAFSRNERKKGPEAACIYCVASASCVAFAP